MSLLVWLPPPLRRSIDRTLAGLMTVGDGHDANFAEPAGEPALFAHDSVSWQVFKNAPCLLLGGVAAVVLELAEPRVRTGVLEHSSFRRDPLARLRRTGRASMVTVYGPKRRAEAAIARIRQLHGPVIGTTPAGMPYRGDDPALLTWVHATASYGFLQARHRHVAMIDTERQDRYYREGLASARLHGALGAPATADDMARLIDAKRTELEPSPLIHEFLDTVRRLPLLPGALAPLQRLLVAAGVGLLPAWVRDRLALGREWDLRPGGAALLRTLLRGTDRLALPSSAPVQACRRLGLPDDHLYRATPGG